MKKYRCYYLNDFNDDYEAMSEQDEYGDWYRVVDVDARIAELEKALDNCRLLAMREAHADPRSPWAHIIRFCTEAGRGPSPLRADS